MLSVKNSKRKCFSNLRRVFFYNEGIVHFSAIVNQRYIAYVVKVEMENYCDFEAKSLFLSGLGSFEF